MKFAYYIILKSYHFEKRALFYNVAMLVIFSSKSYQRDLYIYITGHLHQFVLIQKFL